MVSFNGNVYVGSTQTVNSAGRKLGTIKYFSTNEADDNGSDYFSNFYKVGTNLYTIPDISTADAIAIETSQDKYIKRLISKISKIPQVIVNSILRYL